MQTFLPYPDMLRSLQCLDTKRLGKQRVEAKQLVNAIRGRDLTRPTTLDGPEGTSTILQVTRTAGWANHPCSLMWAGHVEALKHYHNLAILTWIERGYKNTMPLFLVDHKKMILPRWFGDPAFHASHRSNLLRKDPVHYGQFGWGESPDLEYIWPTP